MKMNNAGICRTGMKQALLFGILAAGSLLSALDPGGVTFDFRKSSDGLFKAREIPPSENLIVNADRAAEESPKDPLRWQGTYCFIHSKKLPQDDPRRAQVRKIVKWSVKDGVFTVVKPEELNKILPPDLVGVTSGGWHKGVNLPDARGGRYNITFQYRGRNSGAGGACLIVKGLSEPAGKWWKAKTLFFEVYKIRLSDEYRNYQNAILLPEGIKSVQLAFRIDGVGELHFRKPAVTAGFSGAGEAGKKLTLQLSPMGRLDSTFALARNLPGIIAFMWKRNGTPAEAKMDHPQLVLELPREIAYHESAGLKYLGKKEVGKGLVRHRIDLTGLRKRPATQPDFDAYLRLTALLTTAAAPGSRLAPGRAWVEEAGSRLSNIVKVGFEVIPEFRAGKPEFFMPGVYLGGRCMYFTDPKNIELNARIFAAAGIRWIIGSHKPSYPFWRKAGVKVITPTLSYVGNGFQIGNPKGRPEGDKFRTVGTLNREKFDASTCPAAVYEKRPYYLNSTVPYIREGLKGADGLWANWEPYKYAGRGCFCDTCRRNFARFVGVSEEQMKKEWPRELAVGRKYHKQAVRFRSLEHAKLVKTVNETVIEATGGKGRSLGFIPGVQFNTMGSAWRQEGYDRETHPIDYAGALEWIDPWGPYAAWRAQAPFVYNKSFNLRTFVKAKDVRQAVNNDYAPKPPKLLAFPHGYQLCDWVTQPESIAIELLSYFFNRWEAATVYAFPKGYDARYWKAVADASTVIARYEKYVFQGKRVDDKVTLTAQQPYAADTAIVEPLLGTHAIYRMLQHTAYEFKGALIVAAFNFWRDGEVFFTLKVEGLAPDTRYTVRSRGTRFTGKDGKSFTGRELADGVTLHAGAVRCEIYEIAPEKAADKDLPSLTAAAVEKARQAALPALRKAKAADEAYEKIYGIRESKLENISNAGIACAADPKARTLTFTAGKNKAVLFVPTFVVTDWDTGAGAVLRGNHHSGAGATAFWLPSCQIRGGFAVTAQKKIPGGLEITGEKRMLDRDNPGLAGLVIRQNIELTEGLRKIAVTTTLVNDSDRDLTFGVRYNLIPAPPGGQGGFTRLTVDGKTLDFKRDFSRKLFSTGIDKQYETTVRKLFSVKSATGRMDAAPVFFCKPGGKVRLDLEPKAALAGAAVWDSGKLAAGSFEPCFKLTKLGPGGDSFVLLSTLSVEK